MKSILNSSTTLLLCSIIALFLFTPIKTQENKEAASCDSSSSPSPHVLHDGTLSSIDQKLFQPHSTFANISIASIPNGEPINLRYVQNFLSPSEITQLISFCDDRNGWTASPQSNGISTSVNAKGRTSSSCPLLWPLLYLPKLEKLKALGKLTTNLEKEINTSWTIMQRIAMLLNVNEAKIEPLQLIRYNPGQFYKQHHDHGSYYGKNSEQRPVTFLLFLSSVPPEDGGGYTQFDELDLAILPRAGDGVIWMNEDERGEVLREALHQAVPPREGGGVVKYAMNVWVDREDIMSNLDTVSYRTKLA